MDVKDIKPSFDSVARTEAVFQDSTLTYNEPGMTYNESGLVYAGSDRVQDPAPNLESAWNPIPQLLIVKSPTSLQPRFLTRGMPMGPGFFLYITYPETIEVDIN